MTNRKGFTLIELLIVVVIIGILAAIAIPKFANTKEKAVVASMKSDLRNLVTAQEGFFADNQDLRRSLSARPRRTCDPAARGGAAFTPTAGNAIVPIFVRPRPAGPPPSTNRQRLPPAPPNDLRYLRGRSGDLAGGAGLAATDEGAPKCY